MRYLMLLLLVALPARADEWDTTDKVLYGSFIAMDVIDIAQTYRIKRAETCTQPAHNAPEYCYRTYYENNPIFGKDPNMTKVIAWKAIDVAALGIAANYLPSPMRKAVLLGADVIQFTIIHHNYTVGVKWGF